MKNDCKNKKLAQKIKLLHREEMSELIHNRSDLGERHGNMPRDEGWALFRRRILGQKDIEDSAKQIAMKPL